MKIKLASLLAFLLLICSSAIAQNYANLVSEASAQYKAKNYSQSLKLYELAFKQNKTKPTELYNAACSAALAGKSKKAFQYLEHAIDNNWTNADHLKKDSDLKSLHTEKGWQKLVGKLEEKVARIEANYDKPLQAELLKIYEQDQNIRILYNEVADKLGYNHPKIDSLGKIMRYNDSLNLLKVTTILDKYGWVGKEKVGPHASQTLFLVIQHSNLKTQEKYLPLIRTEAKKGNLNKSSLALLEDRVAIGQGKKQIYGSQIGWNEKTNSHYVLPLEDPKNVDQRRAQMELEPLSEYVSQWKITWNPEEYLKQQTKN